MPGSSGPPIGGSGTSSPVVFASDSVWNQQLPDDAPIDPNSAGMVQGLTAEVAKEESEKTGPWINTVNSSTPIYVVGPDQPMVFVALDDPTAWWRVSLQAAFTAVPIPGNAQPAAGSDSHMTIYQPSTDNLWEFFHMRKLADGWHAAWGGAIDDVSQDPGYYTWSSWPGAASYWGASATSLPLIAGTMTIAELQSGQVDHALAVALPYPRYGAYAWPAQRTDGTGTDPNAIPEGAHLRIDPHLDISALHLPHMTEMMALAAQKYGIIVRDQTHHAVGFYGEDPTPTGTNPYGGRGGLYGGEWPNQFLASFPWRSLEVLSMDLHPQDG